MLDIEEDINILKKKLLYRSIYRGCKEMDIVLGNFASAMLSNLNNQKLLQYKALLDEGDNDIFDWISGKVKKEDVPDAYKNIIIDIINFNNNIIKNA